MTVYHGSSLEVARPDVDHSKRFLDFGPGFYVTSYYDQAARWARRKADRVKGDGSATPILNCYELNGEYPGLKVLDFKDVDEIWFDFVIACRNGDTPYIGYDVIIGRVANDDVYKTIEEYRQGRISKDDALKALRYSKPNDQIVFMTQKAIDVSLRFVCTVKI